MWQELRGSSPAMAREESRANKREMYGRKDLICSCRVRFRMRRWWFLGRVARGGAELIFISVQRGLEGGVNLHVSFATDPSHRCDNGRELKYCPQVLTLLRRSVYSDVVGVPQPLMMVLATVAVARGWMARFHSEILKTSDVTSAAIFRGIYLPLLSREM